MKTVYIILAIFLFASCNGAKDQIKKQPEQIVLNQEVPVLVVTILSNETGYEIIETKREMGTPDLNIIKNREVSIKALDGNGEMLSDLSIEHPRSIRSTGTPHEHATLSEVKFHIVLPYSDGINQIEIESKSEIDKGYSRKFNIIK